VKEIFFPIRFMSKKASEADTKRWPTEMKAMAWFYCLCDKGRVYSVNIVHGDPKSLRWLADSIESGRSNRQMQCVAMALQALDITFMYHPREDMADVDALSGGRRRAKQICGGQARLAGKPQEISCHG
jgi:hypothetical protein